MLENDVKDEWGNFEDVYTFQGFKNGMDYWVDAEEEKALWYMIEYDGNENPFYYIWIIGSMVDLGSGSAKMFTYTTEHVWKKCPNNEGQVFWDWQYTPDGYSFVSTNDVHIKCAYENDFCTSENLCGSDEGDCDTHDECQTGLVCGSNNCPNNLGFHAEYDCCYALSVGDEFFCTPNNPCAIDEGNCYSNNECQTDLFCDIDNSCPAYLGFASDINCCSSLSSDSKSFYILPSNTYFNIYKSIFLLQFNILCDKFQLIPSLLFNN